MRHFLHIKWHLTYPRCIRRRSNLGHIFREKKCVLWAGKYGISLSVSTFRSPLNPIGTRSSSIISCQSVLHTGHALLCFTIFLGLLILLLCWKPFFFVFSSTPPLFSFETFSNSTTFAYALTVEFIFGWLLSWFLTIFTSWSCVQIFCSTHYLCFVYCFNLSQASFSLFLFYIVLHLHFILLLLLLLLFPYLRIWIQNPAICQKNRTQSASTHKNMSIL
jgi:hypothetical protein